MENRSKEQRRLFSNRASTAFLRSNPMRLYFSSRAYLLLQARRRRGRRGTESAQDATLRRKRLKIGARMRIPVRRG